MKATTRFTASITSRGFNQLFIAPSNLTEDGSLEQEFLDDSSLGLKTIVNGLRARSFSSIFCAYVMVGANGLGIYLALEHVFRVSKSNAFLYSVAISAVAVIARLGEFAFIKAVAGGYLATWMGTSKAMLINSLLRWVANIAILPLLFVSFPIATLENRRYLRKNLQMPSTENISVHLPRRRLGVMKPAASQNSAETPNISSPKALNPSDFLTSLPTLIAPPNGMTMSDLFEYAQRRLDEGYDFHRNFLAILNYRLAVSSNGEEESPLTNVYSFPIQYFDILKEDIFQHTPPTPFQKTRVFKDIVAMLACWMAVASLEPEARLNYLRKSLDLSVQFDRFAELMKSTATDPPSLEVWAPAVCLWVRLAKDRSEAGITRRLGEIQYWVSEKRLLEVKSLVPKGHFQVLAANLLKHVSSPK